mmetsp:Transcript_21773/g.36779  ORF Transcript_21773/g.36779 Transcript_21773/m.36779 type:complete len:231 (+) Transcript_21773:1319-2011(+)
MLVVLSSFCCWRCFLRILSVNSMSFFMVSSPLSPCSFLRLINLRRRCSSAETSSFSDASSRTCSASAPVSTFTALLERIKSSRSCLNCSCLVFNALFRSPSSIIFAMVSASGNAPCRCSGSSGGAPSSSSAERGAVPVVIPAVVSFSLFSLAPWLSRPFITRSRILRSKSAAETVTSNSAAWACFPRSLLLLLLLLLSFSAATADGCIPTSSRSEAETLELSFLSRNLES